MSKQPPATLVPIPPDNDPPYSHFSRQRKMLIVFITAITGLVSPLASNMYYPSIQQVRDDLSASQSRVTWTITAFLITMGIFPLIWGNLSDQIGRKPVYIASMLVFTCGSIGCALSHSLGALIASRVIQAVGSSAVQASGAGTIADIYAREERGTALGIYYLGPLLGPCIGPLVGGYVGQDIGWRWVFWILAIWGGAMCLAAIFVLPETHRRIVSQSHRIHNEGIPARATLRENNPILDIATVRFPVIAVVMFDYAMLFGAYFANSTGLPLALQNVYGLAQGTTGLCYLPLGVGTVVGSTSGGRFNDLALRYYKRRMARRDGVDAASIYAPPEVRVRLMWVGSTVFLGTLLGVGWTIHKAQALAGLLVLQFFVGAGMAFSFQCLGNYLIDVFPMRSARITGVQNFWRSVWASVTVQIFPTMLDSVGWGWTYTVMMVLALVGAALVEAIALKGEMLRKRFGPPNVE